MSRPLSFCSIYSPSTLKSLRNSSGILLLTVFIFIRKYLNFTGSSSGNYCLSLPVWTFSSCPPLIGPLHRSAKQPLPIRVIQPLYPLTLARSAVNIAMGKFSNHPVPTRFLHHFYSLLSVAARETSSRQLLPLTRRAPLLPTLPWLIFRTRLTPYLRPRSFNAYVPSRAFDSL